LKSQDNKHDRKCPQSVAHSGTFALLLYFPEYFNTNDKIYLALRNRFTMGRHRDIVKGENDSRYLWKSRYLDIYNRSCM